MGILEAIEFVNKNGSEEDILCLNCILEGKKADPPYISELIDLQNKDGGFPYNFEKGNTSTLMDSTAVLVIMEEFNYLDHEIVEKIVKFLLNKQEEDGSWNESEDIVMYNPPIWMDPRNLHVKILSTAYVGYWLAKLGYDKDDRVKRACEFLTNYRHENGSFEGFLHSTWIAASLFAKVYGKEHEVVRNAIRYLISIPKHLWTPPQLSWLLWSFGSVGFTKEEKNMGYFVDLLLNIQREDGSFVTEREEPYSVRATIEAIKALKKFV